MDAQDLCWLAGLLEGEGSFRKPPPCEAKYPRITLQMTDLDVVQRVTALFGINYICKNKAKKEHWKDSYTIVLKGKRAIRIMNELYPLMGERRKQRIENAIGYQSETEYILSDEDWIYWLAGLLEGEGSFMKGTPSHPESHRIHVNMTDQDVIAKAAEIMGVNPSGPYKRTGRDAQHKPHYFAILVGAKGIELMKQLRPLMGQRRQVQIDAVIAAYAPKPHPRGENHPQAKLNTEKVRDIKTRLANGERLGMIAAKYGVDIGLIWQIKAGRIWQHVT
jgi:hypothetical protein